MEGIFGISVLVAVDDRSTRNVYRFLMGVAGYSAIKAPDARTAIDVLQTDSGTVIALLDWDMPKSGCIGILRALAHTPDIAVRHRFVLLTRAPDTLHSHLLTLPACLAITLLRKPVEKGKPVEKAKLLAAVESVARTIPARPLRVVSAQ